MNPIDWLEYLGLTPAHILGFVLGTFIAVVVTQTVKKVAGFGDLYAFWFAVMAGFLACYTIAPPEGFALSWPSLWLSVLCGLASTRVYKLGFALLVWWKPELADVLSGGRRAQ